MLELQSALYMYGREQERSWSRNWDVRAVSVNFFLLATVIMVARPVDEAALEAEAKGSDPAKLSMPGMSLACGRGRLREAMLEQGAERGKGGIGVEASMRGAGSGTS